MRSRPLDKEGLEMLPQKHLRIYKFIQAYMASNGIAPTIAEIGQQFGLRSSASVYDILVALENQGLIERTPNVSRGIKLTNHLPENAAQSLT